MKKKVCHILIVFIFVFIIQNNINAKTNKITPHELYLKINKIFNKWEEGLFGSKNFHRRQLVRLLSENIGNQIITANEFTLRAPYEAGRKKFYCKFHFGSWLQIWGYVTNDALKEVYLKSRKTGTRWWRSAKLVSISGKIRKYNLNRTRFGDCVIIYLENIRFIYKNPEDAFINIEKNNKIEKLEKNLE